MLADGRLVTVGEDEVEVAHEALLREWPRLRSWLEDDVEGRRLHRHLTDDAADWEAAGREPSVLYRGARLASVLEWSETHGAELNTSERDFVEHSRAAAERDEQRQRQANRRLRVLVGGIAALLAVAVVAGVVAVTQRGEARNAALEADAARLGSDGVARERLDQAMLLARAGIDLHESVATRSSLMSVVMRSPAVLKVLPTDGWPQFSVAVSHDGSLAAVGSERGTVMIFDARSGRPRGTYEAENLVQGLAFSPDGATLAATVDTPPGALLDIVDVNTRKRLRRVELPAPEREAELVVAYPRFAPDGNLVVIQMPLGPAAAVGRAALRPADGEGAGPAAGARGVRPRPRGDRRRPAARGGERARRRDLRDRPRAAAARQPPRGRRLGSRPSALTAAPSRSAASEGERAAARPSLRTRATTRGHPRGRDPPRGLRRGRAHGRHHRQRWEGQPVGYRRRASGDALGSRPQRHLRPGRRARRPDGVQRGKRRSRARVGRLGRAASRHPVLRRRADCRRRRPLPPRSRVRSGGPDVRADAGRRQRPVRRCPHAAGRGKPPRARRRRARSRRQSRRRHGRGLGRGRGGGAFRSRVAATHRGPARADHHVAGGRLLA